MFSHNATIPKEHISTLEKKLEAINRRCAAVCQIPLTFTTQPTQPFYEYQKEGEFLYSKNKYIADRTGVVIPRVEVTIVGDAPVWNGWTVIAKAVPLETKNLFMSFQSEFDFSDFENRVGECDHCETIRGRICTFVIRKEELPPKMVGRSCLAKYVGSNDVDNMVGALETFLHLPTELEIMEDSDYYSSRPSSIGYDVLTVLRYTAAVIRKDGWMSRTKAGEYDRPTSYQVREILLYPLVQLVEHYEPNENDRTLAQKTLSWMHTLKKTNDSMYLYNLGVIAEQGWADSKGAGFGTLVSAVPSYQVYEDKKRSELPFNETSIGEIKERIEVKLTCLKSWPHQSSYSSFGVTQIHLFKDTEDRRLVWFATGGNGHFVKGETATVKATIKAYEKKFGKMQTIINRVKRQ